MHGNKLKNILQEIRAVLEPDLQKSGAVFYSGRRTLEKGNFYLMGLNPGGDPNKEGKICSSLDEWEKYEHDWSAYVNDNWTKTPGKEGKAQHQENVRYLCDKVLSVDSANVFSANAMFLRSRDGNKLDTSDACLSRCWKLHVRFLTEVKPRVLICLGNGPGSSFEYARKWLGAESDIERRPEPCGFRGMIQSCTADGTDTEDFAYLTPEILMTLIPTFEEIERLQQLEQMWEDEVNCSEG